MQRDTMIRRILSPLTDRWKWQRRHVCVSCWFCALLRQGRLGLLTLNQEKIIAGRSGAYRTEEVAITTVVRWLSAISLTRAIIVTDAQNVWPKSQNRHLARVGTMNRQFQHIGSCVDIMFWSCWSTRQRASGSVGVKCVNSWNNPTAKGTLTSATRRYTNRWNSKSKKVWAWN